MHVFLSCNGKYMEQKTETKEKEAHCLTLSRIPGSAYLAYCNPRCACVLKVNDQDMVIGKL